MNVFEAVKQSVTTRQAAEHYGIRIGRNGMACCPFHNDKTPSMKLDQRYHCFGCGADGDVIDFTAALYGLGKKEAAVQLAQDFGLSYEDWKPPVSYTHLLNVRKKLDKVLMGGKFAEQTVVNPTAFQQCHHLIVQMQLRQWRVDLLPVLCPAQQIIDGNPIEVCQRDKVRCV